MNCLKQFPSLEERALVHVAINLCQDIGFKEVALWLEKPTYGFFKGEYTPYFVSIPEKLSTWATVEETSLNKSDYDESVTSLDDESVTSLNDVTDSFCIYSERKEGRWNAAVDDQCQKLTEGLPHIVKHKVQTWMTHIALEYLSFTRRQEAIFGVSRYLLMDVLTRGDWTEAGQLDEKKIMERLLKDQRLTVLQMYRIACVYCLHANIPHLWRRLTQNEKHSVSEDHAQSKESHCLVLSWSTEMEVHWNKIVTGRKKHRWTYVAEQAMYYGNRAALMLCWKMLKENIRQKMVNDMALKSLRQWNSITGYHNLKEDLLSSNLPSEQSHESVKYFNLPSYYSDMILFFLSEMNTEQQLTFWKKAFQSKDCKYVLECFLEWPHQDMFLLMLNQLWGIIPKDKYGECIITLASRYSTGGEKENQYYDYRRLLWMLWEKTPEEYKQYLFIDKNPNYYQVINEGRVLLPILLDKSPFQEQDETLFKFVFNDQPQEERRAMMHCEVGNNICSKLMQKEMWSLLNWLLVECVSKEEIPTFKKHFIESECGHKLCCSKLEDNDERFVEDIIDWCFTLDIEKTQYKIELIEGNICLGACNALMRNGNFSQVECIINFCLYSNEMKSQFKVRLAKYICCDVLQGYRWRDDYKWMDEILEWSNVEVEKIRDIKKDIFNDAGVNSHFELVFISRDKEEKMEQFYKWFSLSPKEIEKLKRDTMFESELITLMQVESRDWSGLSSYRDSLRYCLTDRKVVVEFKKKIEEQCFNHVLCEVEKKAKRDFNDIVYEILYELREKNVQNKANGEGVFIKDNGEKRLSDATEDESSSPKKQFK